MRHRLTWIVVAALSVGCSSGYAPGDNPEERDAAVQEDAGADASPNLDADGSADAQSSDSGDPSDTAPPDASTPDTGRADTGSLCAPNHDGVIERCEVSMEPGNYARFKVAEDVTFDTRGTEQADGSRVWDLSGDLPGDETLFVELKSLDGTWFNPEYPDADYASKLAIGEDNLGVFGTTDDGVYLHGVVSPEDGLYATELKYDPPATILQFPIERGSTWTSDSDVSGRYLGNPWTAADEEYASQVDAHGTLKTPYGTFDNVLRVRTDMTRTVGLLVTRTRTYSFVSEGFGTVALIRSKDNPDSSGEFTEAAEVRRLAQ